MELQAETISQQRGHTDQPLRILLVSDDPALFLTVRAYLHRDRTPPVHLDRVSTPDECMHFLLYQPTDALMLDIESGTVNAPKFISELRHEYPGLAILVLANSDNRNGVVARALEEGASDYLLRSQMDSGATKRTVKLAVERQKLESALQSYRKRLAESTQGASGPGDSGLRVEQLVGFRRAIRGAVSCETVLRLCLEHMCEALSCLVGRAWVASRNDDEVRLTSSVTWYSKAPGIFRCLREAAQGTGYSPDIDFPGMAFHSGEPLFCEDAASDPRCLLGHAYAVGGIRSCVAIPLMHAQEAVGVVECFSDQKIGWDERIASVLDSFGRLAAPFIVPPAGGTTEAEVEVARADRRALEAKDLELAQTIAQLRRTQEQLVVQQKLASLGSLTAGIAHEIKNPLNFVVNFSEFSVELVDELSAIIDTQKDRVHPEALEALRDILADLKQKVEKAAEHGRRADSIVKGMLQHSRGDTGDRQPTNLNAMVAEYLSLAYHGMRAQDSAFNATIDTSYDENIGMVTLVPQDISRVILNLVNNACYAVRERAAHAGQDYAPRIGVRTCDLGSRVEVRIRDNGTGIAPEVREHILEPFVTTKPAGQGTGLGLSLCYDIVVHQHRGELAFDSVHGEYTEFVMRLPKDAPGPFGGAA